MRRNVAVLAAAVVVAGLMVAGAVLLVGRDRQPTRPTAQDTTPAATEQVSGHFSIYTNRWFDTIPNTTWNRCNGQPECDGSQCYGTGVASGLGAATDVVVTDGTGAKVALGKVSQTWGWRRGATGGLCVLYWSAAVPQDAGGVLAVTFQHNPSWSADFTLAKMRRLPHALDFLGIGDLNS
jgi:hypothetical protein